MDCMYSVPFRTGTNSRLKMDEEAYGWRTERKAPEKGKPAPAATVIATIGSSSSKAPASSTDDRTVVKIPTPIGLTVPQFKKLCIASQYLKVPPR